jgi:anaerobic selenocysteine-containing dehydrogenase
VKVSDRHTVYRVCPFCEATCGLAIEVEGDSIITVRGDKEDPFSCGFICPEAYGLKELHDDADRLTVAKAHAGVNTNILTDDRAYDEARAPPSCSALPSPSSR